MAILWTVVVIVFLVLLVGAAILMQPLALWLQSSLSGARCSLREIIGYHFDREIRADLVVLSRIKAGMGGFDVTPHAFAEHQRIGGRPDEVVNAMLIRSGTDDPLSFEEACALDLEFGPGLADAMRQEALDAQNGVEEDPPA